MSSRSPLPLLLSCLLLMGSVWGCQLHHDSDEEEATSSESSESSTEDLFRDADGGSGDIEDRGEDLEDRAEEIRSMDGSEQEKIDAVMEFEKEREKLNEDAGVN